jgi:ABC-type molybdenum transport system ATPase subunit/photorepair protein PhrA
VFTDIDLAIDKGSHVVVLGLNGAGKTTLLRILRAWMNPTPVRSSKVTACVSATTPKSMRLWTSADPYWPT